MAAAPKSKLKAKPAKQAKTSTGFAPKSQPTACLESIAIVSEPKFDREECIRNRAYFLSLEHKVLNPQQCWLLAEKEILELN